MNIVNDSELEPIEDFNEQEDLSVNQYGTETMPSLPFDSCIANINNLASNICNGITTWKQINKDMHEMDVQFNMFSKQMDTNLQMYKQRAPIVSRQLDSINSMMNKILDRVLSMETETEAEFNDKMRMMDSVDTYVDRITTMMTNLL